MTPRVLDLFSGIGGFSLAFEREGFETVAFSEIEPFPCQALSHHWPYVPNLGDVTKIKGETLGRVDVITAGFPCQDLSVAGKRAGLVGSRSGLFWQIIRLARETRAPWLVLENVPGLLSSNEGRDFAIVIDALSELGYGVAWRICDAQYFGVPQRRRRVFIVGCLGGPCPPQILFEPEGLQGNIEESREAGEEAPEGTRDGVAKPLGGGSGARGWMNDLDHATYLPEVAGDEVAGTPTKGSGKRGWAPDTDRMTFIPEVVGGQTTRYGKGANCTVDDGAIIPIQDGREVEKEQNGLGVGKEGDPAYTLDSLATQAVGFYANSGYKEDPVSGADAPLKGGKENAGQAAITFDPGQSDNPKTTDLSVVDGCPPLISNRGYAVAFAENQRGEVRESDGETSLSSGGGKPGSGYSAVAVGIDGGDVGFALRANPSHSGDKGDGGVNTTLAMEGRVDPTLSANEGGTLTQIPPVQSGMAVRRLTPTECARLQGFPDDWLDLPNASDSAKYRALGNSVAVPVVRWIARRLMQAAKQVTAA